MYNSLSLCEDIRVLNKYAKQSRVVTSEKNKRALQTAGEFLYNLNHAIKL